MKKSLIALATLAAVSGSAFAQSTVTLFGGADLNYRTVSSGANKFTGMAQDGIYSSRLGFMGTEDLGGGLKANFHFEGGMNPDVGTSAKFDFGRKSIIGLSGGFGEVRLGRDYTPLFTVAGIADPFGTNGVGSSYTLANAWTIPNAVGIVGTFAAVTAASTTSAAVVPASYTYADPNAVRANNSITYYSPSFSGFTASLMYGLGNENTAAQKKTGMMTSLKLAYATGPVAVAYANQVTNGGTTTPATDNQKWTTNFLAASYDLGVAKLSAGYKTDKLTNVPAMTGTAKSTILGATAPMGAVTLKASLVSRKLASTDLGNQFALGAIYDLSKRTSVYTTYSVLTNKNGLGNTVGSTVASAANIKSKGAEVGVKHNF